MTAKIATINTGVIAIAANTATILFCKFDPAALFLIFLTSFIISLIMEKNNIRKKINPAKERIIQVLGCYLQSCISNNMFLKQ